MLTWLHLSDLQLQKGDGQAVLDQLQDDVKRSVREENLSPDFICVTGDVADSGQPAEYERARKFFDKLLASTSVPKERVFIIPGNHDFNWQASPIKHQDLSKTAAEESADAPNASSWTIGLHSYYEFVAELLGARLESEENQFYVRQFTLDQIRIAVLGLNTAWLGNVGLYVSDDLVPVVRDQFRQQVKTALDQVRDAQVKIALVHHSLDRLRKALRDDETLSQDQEDPSIQDLLERCDFILHSHVMGQAQQPRMPVLGAVVIDGGSDPGMDEHPNAYNWVRLDFASKTLTVHPRRYSSERGGRWVPDDEVTFTLPPRLSSLPPPGEQELEEDIAWRPPFAGYATDAAGGDDQLDITSDVNAFSAVFASKQVGPPLCLGLFGDWGAGKTFFMDKMWDRIELLKEKTAEAKERSSYYPHIVQIRFNAWHYIDTNLWASLANHIFQELAAYISRATGKTDEEKEAEKAQLFQELETAKKLRNDAKAEQDKAAQLVGEAKERLKKARADREAIPLEPGDLTAAAVEEILGQNDGLKEKLAEAAELVGVSSAGKTAQEVSATWEEVRTVWGQFRTSFQEPGYRRSWIILFLLVLVVIPLSAFAVNSVLSAFLDSPELISSISCIVTQVVTVLAVVNRCLKPALSAMRKLRDVRTELNKRLQARTEVELSALEERELAARKTLAEAQERFARAETAVQEIEGIKDERRLMQFIHERVTGREYEKHLGIVSAVHDDFKSLSEMLGKGDDPTLPRIDRIILYIDDLDRCPEDKVVDVLQAVHLLLAFRLFIVVVGVDSRWLLRSLERSYPALLKIKAEQTGLSEEEAWAWESTPQDYLEKIFQIPFNLRRMDEGGVRKLVNGILVRPASRPGGREQPPTGTTTEPGLAQDKEASTEIVLDNGGLPTSEPGLEPSSPGGDVVPPVPEPPVEPPAQEPEEEPQEIDLTPPGLDFESWETDFIPQLTAMLPTPRAVKRFINIYRLIRARIPPLDLPEFVSERQGPCEYQVVMVLLAMLTGFPRQASHVFGKVLSLQKGSPWSDVVDALEPKELQGTGAQRFSNGVVPSMGAAEAADWRRLFTALSTLQPEAPLPSMLEPYKRWARRVARFSFRAGKIADGSVE